MQLFRASPYAPEWSGNIHESKLSDIHRPTPSRLPIGRLKSYKYKKSAYGGKKSPARAGKKGLAHRYYALHDNQDYMGGCFFTANGGLFERPKAAFFTVVVDGVMHSMTVEMVEATRRKTRFPTIGATVHAKAKPPSTTRLFVFISSPLTNAKNSGEDT